LSAFSILATRMQY